MSSTAAQRPLKPLWHLIPSGWSIPFVLLATSWVGLLGSCMGVTTVTGIAEGKPAMHEIEMCFLVLGFAILPVAALLLFVAALAAGRWAARSALLVLTLLTSAVGLASMLVSSLLSDEPAGAAALAAVIYAVPSGVLILAAIISVVLAVREIKRSIAARREHRIAELLHARGEVSFDTLAEDLDLSKAAAVSLVRDLLQNQTLQAVVDEESGMAFAPYRYARKQWDLVSVVYGRGEVALDALCEELGLSEARVKALLVEAMQSGRFAGYVDWRKRRVVSGDAARMRQGHQCPSCGAQMQLAGRGLVTCSYCGAEVFLS